MSRQLFCRQVYPSDMTTLCARVGMVQSCLGRWSCNLHEK